MGRNNIIVLHKSSGKEYLLLHDLHFKIFGIWIHITHYEAMDSYDKYFRLTSDFNKKFLVKE